MNIAITGSSGLIGSTFVEYMFQHGNTIIPIQRNKDASSTSFWDFSSLNQLYREGKNIDAIIHLAGENIASGRWTKSKKQRILQSRVEGSKELVRYILKSPAQPKTVIFASAIGFYGDRGEDKLTEESIPGHTFLAQVCKEWERTAKPLVNTEIRLVQTRFGMVLSPAGGALQQMLPPFKLGLGGKIGSGRQFMSWIHIQDLLQAIHHILLTPKVSGPINIVSPDPATNIDFTKTLCKALKKPSFLPMPAPIVSLFFGEMGKELLLASSRVLPEKLVKSGYTFSYPELLPALLDCILSD